MKRVLQGMRPSGKLHLGNYLGTAKGMLALQENEDYETFYMVVDLHGMTTPFDPKTIKRDSREVIIDYLSIGLDPEKSAIFVQSDLADLHTQLMYYFSTTVTVARMQHLPTFKEKVKQYPENATMALLNYPILMAADILLYKAETVPVGLDQEPHMEVAREIARKMNANYGADFPEPESYKTDTRYIPSLTGEGKMSKSVEGSSIQLTDDLPTIKKRLASTPTDSGKGDIKDGLYFSEEAMKNSSDPKDLLPSKGVESLMTFVEIFQGKEKRKKYEKSYQGEGLRYSDLKKDLSESIYEELKPIQERRKEFEKDPEKVEKILKEGAEKARVVAEQTVHQVKEKMGLI